MKSFYIQVLETNRESNMAYVARSYPFKLHLNEIKRDDKWYNSVEPLDKVEKFFGCEFKDGIHPYVQALIDWDNWNNEFKKD